MFQVVSNLWARWAEFVWSSTLMKNSRNKYTACDSPECVRCHRYQQVREEAWGKLQRFGDKHGWQGLEPLLLAIGEGKRYREVRRKIGHDRSLLNDLMPLPLQNPNVLFVPTVQKKPWWDTVGGASDAPLNHSFVHEQITLEANHDVILDEFDAVFKDLSNWSSTAEGAGDYVRKQGELKQWVLNSTEKGKWCAFHLYNQGKKMTDSCHRCPQTTKLVESLSSAMTGSLFGNVSFSVIFPGTHIDEHYGPCNVRIRCHLGLRVPEGCTLKVAGEERKWLKGKTTFFDDSFLHSATNSNSTEVRAVLLVDLWHPDLSNRVREALLHVF